MTARNSLHGTKTWWNISTSSISLLKFFGTASLMWTFFDVAVLSFRELFCQITDVDPFASCLTIASACNLVFRKTFLQEDTITIIPPCGYKPENRHSVIAMKMLNWISQQDNIGIRHARNQGRNVSVNISPTGLMKKATQCGRFMVVSGMGASDAIPGIR